MDELSFLSLIIVVAAFFCFLTFIITDGGWVGYGKESIERGFIILDGDKYRLERVE